MDTLIYVHCCLSLLRIWSITWESLVMRRSMLPPCPLQLQSRLSRPWLPSWANKEMAKVCVIVLSSGRILYAQLYGGTATQAYIKLFTDVNLQICPQESTFIHALTNPHTYSFTHTPIHPLILLFTHSPTHAPTRSINQSVTWFIHSFNWYIKEHERLLSSVIKMQIIILYLIIVSSNYSLYYLNCQTL